MAIIYVLIAIPGSYLLTTFVLMLAYQINFHIFLIGSILIQSTELRLILFWPTVLIFIISGGSIVNLSTLPTYISWIQYISHFKYSTEALVLIQMKDQLASSIDYDLLSSFGFNQSNLYFDLIILVTMYLIVNIFLYLLIIYNIKKR